MNENEISDLIIKAYSHQKLQENQIAIDYCKKIQNLDPKNKSMLNLLSELTS